MNHERHEMHERESRRRPVDTLGVAEPGVLPLGTPSSSSSVGPDDIRGTPLLCCHCGTQ